MMMTMMKTPTFNPNPLKTALLLLTTLLSLTTTTALATIPPGYANFPCNGTILPTPTYGYKDAVFTVCGQSTIAASQHAVSNAILDFPRYEIWNTFIINASVPADVCTPDCVYAPGLTITFTSQGIVPGPPTVGHDVTSYIERPDFFAWTNTEYEVETGHSEHVSLFIPQANGQTKYLHWQTQYGAGAVNLLPVYGNFQAQFQKQADELKVYVESL